VSTPPPCLPRPLAPRAWGARHAASEPSHIERRPRPPQSTASGWTGYRPPAARRNARAPRGGGAPPPKDAADARLRNPKTRRSATRRRGGPKPEGGEVRNPKTGRRAGGSAFAGVPAFEGMPSGRPAWGAGCGPRAGRSIVRAHATSLRRSARQRSAAGGWRRQPEPHAPSVAPRRCHLSQAGTPRRLRSHTRE
jgi:hypothetical protein